MAFAQLFTGPGSLNVNAVLQHLTGVCAVYWNDPAGIALLQSQVGSTDTALYIFDISTAPTNIAAFRIGNHLHVVSDGTLTLIPQAILDISGALGTRYEGTNQVVHSYFYANARQIVTWLKQKYGDNLNQFTSATLTGHSLGSASLGVTASLLRAEGVGNIQPVLFASPKWFARPVLNPWNGPIVNLHGPGDLIAYIPSETANASMLISPEAQLITGAPIRWADLTTHYQYTGQGIEPAPDSNAYVLWDAATTSWANQHTAAYHIQQVVAWYRAVNGPGSVNPMVTYLEGLLSRPEPSYPLPVYNNLTGQQIAELQNIYFPNNTQVTVNENNFRDIRLDNVSEQPPFGGNGSIIGLTNNNLGDNNMALSGYKATAYFETAEKRGWSVSMYSQATTLAAIETQFDEFCQNYVYCLGHTPSGKSTPILTFKRYQPLQGSSQATLRDVSLKSNTYSGSDTDYPCNYPGVALFNRLTVSTTLPGGAVASGSRSFFLQGVPDGMIDGLFYKKSWDAAYKNVIRDFWAYLQDAASPWCVLTKDPSTAKGVIQSGSIVGGQWVLQATGVAGGSVPLAAGDRILISAANPVGQSWNGSWKISAVSTTNNTITLSDGPPSGTANIQSGKWTKSYDAASKTPSKILIPFTSGAKWDVLAATEKFKVRTRKVGAPFSPYRSARRSKRAKLISV